MNDAAIYETVRSQVVEFMNNDEESFEMLNGLPQDARRALFPINHFDQVLNNFSQRVQNDPFTYFPPCEEAVRQVAMGLKGRDNPSAQAAMRLGFTGWLGSHQVSPRGLCADLVNTLVSVEGIVSRTSLVHPKLTKSVHISTGGAQFTKEHADAQSFRRDKFHVGSLQVPKQDRDGHPFDIEIGLCDYKDVQRLTLQEMPESAPTGQLPRSVEVIFQDDLVDAAKPGDRIRVYGVYRSSNAGAPTARLSGFCKALVIAINAEKLNTMLSHPQLGPSDIKTVRSIAAHPRTLQVLARSVAASIAGHDRIKQGILLQLLGGSRRCLESGMKIRGDIHTLLIGEPSCGKSQLLRFMLSVAPLAISTTGRGASGVGLTAAVTNDPETGERRLEAGAMVLADGGFVCIDEFDKMSHEDRVSIHEVMEQQTITICKAGIHTTLNARCSVLAAANPVYGSFDVKSDLRNQISFPDSLLSRFDLIYIVRDSQTAAEDRTIARKVLGALRENVDHFHITQKRRDGNTILQPNVAAQEEQAMDVIEEKDLQTAEFPPLFLRKYLYFCHRHCEAPVLTDEACMRIAEFYCSLRQEFAKPTRKNISIPTARTLEACIRLATAHAKLKLRTEVLAEDTKVAEILLTYTLLGKVLEIEQDEVDPTPSTEPSRRKRSRRVQEGAENQSTEALSQSLAGLSITDRKHKRRGVAASPPARTSSDRFEKILEILAQPSVKNDGESVASLLRKANKAASGEGLKAFTAEEFSAALDRLLQDNRVIIADDAVWFI